jgi:DNA adenine methylase
MGCDKIAAMPMLEAPFPYFGGKSRVADRVWQTLGQPDHYIEPFFGSGAVLLRRPDWKPEYTETVNDKDAFVCNVWRAIKLAPEETARWADWPVNHADLSARRLELIRSEAYLAENIARDLNWCDPRLAGYWIWAASCWIGTGLTEPIGNIKSKIPRLTGKGQGVNKSRIRLHCNERRLYEWFIALSNRLSRVEIFCDDWKQACEKVCCSPNQTVGIFLDPPYSTPNRKVVYHYDNQSIAAEVLAWCLEHGAKENYRIVVAGYEEYEPLLKHGWWAERWTRNGGYANMAKDELSRAKLDRHRERLYFSPHCLRGPTTLTLPTFEWAVIK